MNLLRNLLSRFKKNKEEKLTTTEENTKEKNVEKNKKMAIPIYLNNMNASKQQIEIDEMNFVEFGIDKNELHMDWFHPKLTRTVAETLLLKCKGGTFLIRPSSQRGSYAISWVEEKEPKINEKTEMEKMEEATVKHQLIYGINPGFSLLREPNEDQIFDSISQLIQSCSFLKYPYKTEEDQDLSSIIQDHSRKSS